MNQVKEQHCGTILQSGPPVHSRSHLRFHCHFDNPYLDVRVVQQHILSPSPFPVGPVWPLPPEWASLPRPPFNFPFLFRGPFSTSLSNPFRGPCSTSLTFQSKKSFFHFPYLLLFSLLYIAPMSIGVAPEPFPLTTRLD